jgi:SAM-dependent methyltransferase
VDAAVDGVNVRRVLDVGCGTGIASQLFLDRGCEVVGVEPDARMASVARRRGVNVVVAAIESWAPPPAEPFDLVVSAQAWHWVDQNVGATVAADALRPGGRLALLSNGYQEVSLRDELDAIYRQYAPQIIDKTFVLGRPGLTLTQAHAGPIEMCGQFGSADERSFRWEHVYACDEWLDQLPTHSDHRTLRPDELSTLLEQVAAVIYASGGTLTIGHTTDVLLAVRK